jgi:glycosyltransferase involved in cell wall biosynthesis
MDFCVAKPEQDLHKKEIKSLGSKIIHCPIHPFLTFQHRLARIFIQNQYDVVHSHGWLFSGVAMKVAHRCKVPVRIAHSHTTSDKYSPTLYRKCYGILMRRLIMKHSTHCLGCGKAAAAALFGPKWRNIDKCGIVYYCFDDEKFRPGQKRSISKKDFGLSADAAVVGHVGNFRLAKNHTFLIDIAGEVVKRQRNVFFFFAGDGELRTEIEAKARRVGISDRIIFAGSRKDVPELMMDLFDVLVFPSIYEGLPLTLFEAATTGLRVVCSDVITREVSEPLPEAFTYLPLSLSAEQWAIKINEVLSQGRIPHEYAYQKYKDSHFSAERSLRELCLYYGCQNSK